MPPKVAVIILNWNGKKDTLSCLASLTKQNYPNFEILVVDNGSEDDSLSTILQAYPYISLLETFHNLGYAKGNNLGIQHALKKHADYLLLLNNDTILDPAFLTKLVEFASLKPKGGIFGGKVLKLARPDTFDHMGGYWNPKTAKFCSLYFGEKDMGQLHTSIEVDYICGCAILIKQEVIQKVGSLDPRFFLLWEESDLCMRAKKKGFEVWLTPAATLWHKGSASFSSKAEMDYYWWRNRLLWIEKNCSRKEKALLYARIVIKECFKIYRRRLCKRKDPNFERYKAGCRGIYDYYKKNFGPLVKKPHVL